MAKMVEMTFAIGAALAGSFAGTFGKAGRALSDLQKQTSGLQKVSGQIGSYQKMQGSMSQTSEKLNAARMRVKELGLQMKSAGTPTAAMKREFTAANVEAHRLEVALGNQRKKLGELRTELTGAGVDTRHLASEQARLTEQSQKAANAQAKLQASRAELESVRSQLSLSNIKGELIAAAGAGYSLYKPVMQAADFEQAMARVNAVAFTGGDKSDKQRAADAEDFKALQEQARQLGRDTQFTAVQAAQSQENLARAGFKANEIMSAMPGLLSMAAAEGMDLANAADIAASTLRGFNLEADQSGRVADVLAQMSAASNTSISGLGESMKYVAPVAAGLGVSVEQTAAMLGVMGNAGIKGSQARTALRAAFLRLSKEPKAVANALARLGIRAKDAQGRMRKMPDLMKALSERMNGMGEGTQMQYLTNIFGGEAASGMLAVMRASVDGTLQSYEQLGKESTGVLKALADSVGVSMDEMRAGMKSASPIAEELGISFRDLSIYLAMLAENGIKGADADKTLTAMFKRLKKEPKQVERALKSMKIDTSKMHDIPDLLKEIDKATAGMSDAEQLKALTQIFGKDAASGMQAMMKSISGGSLEKHNKTADEAKGTSYEMMQKLLATFSGQLEIAKSAFADFMIEIGNVLLPYATSAVKAFTWMTSGVTEFMRACPVLTKVLVTGLGVFSAWKVAFVGVKTAWLLAKLPYLKAKVAVDTLSAKLLQNGKVSLLSAAKTKVMAAAQKSWQVVMKAGRGLLDAGKLVLYHAKQLLVTGATKAWTGAQKLWSIAMKGGSKLLDVGKLVLYYGKQIAISVATKAWTAAQWLWNAAMTANPIGLIIVAIAGAIAIGYLLYKNWDKLKAWWNSWTINDVFAALKGYAQAAWNYVKQKWNEFWIWWDSWSLADVFTPVKGYVESAKEYAKQKWADLQAWWDSWTFADVFAPVKEYAGEAKDYAMQKLTDLQTWWDSWTLSDIFSPMLEKGRAVWDKFSSTIETVKNLASEKLSGIWDKTVTAYEQARSIIVGKVLTPVLEFSWNALVEGWNVASGLVSAGFDKLKELLHIDFSGFWDTLASGFATVCDSLKGAWNGVTGFIKDTWNTAADYVSGAWKWTKGLFGYDTDAEDLQTQLQDITALNKMSEDFTQRVAEMTQAWHPFKDSLGEGFEQIYSVMQGIGDRIRGTVIPAVNELTSALSKVALEIASIVQAGTLEVDVHTPNTATGSYSRTFGGRKRAEGGIITRPEIALIGEAGREAIIPLENQSRGASLWLESGRELGLLQNTAVIPHAAGGIFTQPHIGLVAEAGREAIIPLEKQSRGASLWLEAGRELGLIPKDSPISASYSNNVMPSLRNIPDFKMPNPLEDSTFGIPLWKAAEANDGASSRVSTSNITFNFDPHVTVTVNGGDKDLEDRIRGIFSNVLEDMFIECQNRMQDYVQRVSFE